MPTKMLKKQNNPNRREEQGINKRPKTIRELKPERSESNLVPRVALELYTTTPRYAGDGNKLPTQTGQHIRSGKTVDSDLSGGKSNETRGHHCCEEGYGGKESSRQ